VAACYREFKRLEFYFGPLIPADSAIQTHDLASCDERDEAKAAAELPAIKRPPSAAEAKQDNRGAK